MIDSQPQSSSQLIKLNVLWRAWMLCNGTIHSCCFKFSGEQVEQLVSLWLVLLLTTCIHDNAASCDAVLVAFWSLTSTISRMRTSFLHRWIMMNTIFKSTWMHYLIPISVACIGMLSSMCCTLQYRWCLMIFFATTQFFELRKPQVLSHRQSTLPTKVCSIMCSWSTWQYDLNLNYNRCKTLLSAQSVKICEVTRADLFSMLERPTL